MPGYDQSVSEKFVPITPSDSTSLMIRGFHVGGAGDVVCTGADGADATFKACQAGAYYPYAARKIKLTGTTATFIVGLV